MDNKPVYWECKIDGHAKFWAARVMRRTVYDGPTGETTQRTEFVLERKWGAIGTVGQQMEQVFYNEREAEEMLEKLMADKRSKGYEPIF